MKRLYIILIVLLSSMLLLLLDSCTQKKMVIGVSQCCSGVWREKVNNEMRLAQYQYKNVDLLFTTAENDGQRQARQIDSMIARKVDLIVVAPDNVTDVTPAIERAYRAHIPVILFDRKVKTSHYTASIGGDNVEAGREVARFLASKLDGKGTVVEITGLKDASPVIIALQYQDLEVKMKNLDQISDSLDSYSEVSRIQQWMIIVAVVIVLVLLIIIFYIYKVYRKKLQKQKAVARGFIENKEGWAAELNHLDESDRYFMDRFKKKILENMGNADMKMDDLGAEMQLSKVQLYRKVKAMTGKTPVELLKEMRLQRAYTLLQQTDKTISEVSAEVGFALPGYFSSCFKKQFGILPTDLRHKQVSKE